MNEEMNSEGKKKFSITEGIVNALLIFILGFLVGVSVKSEAKKRVTIGYEDYLTSKFTSDFDLAAEGPLEGLKAEWSRPLEEIFAAVVSGAANVPAPQPEQNPSQ